MALSERWDLALESGVRLSFFDYLDDVSGDYPNLDDLGNPLSVRMANRSLEEVAARTGETRNLQPAISRLGIEAYEGFDGQSYRTLATYRRGQTTRGNPRSNDFYFVTGIRLSYIINVGLKCPQFR
ncbi:MAG: hypothetical protein HC880_18130 [Bacteroidia bacterium]|nr:hypothetical protein [Bacteroidia bacterium]